MNIYAAGGAATNIVKKFVKYNKKKSEGFAEIVTYFLDTSKSNMDENIPEDQCYFLDGLDGSGKLRSSNYEALKECSKEILHKFKPADVNVIVNSASGGTGSTLSPILVNELLSRNELTIVITIGSTGSRKETENTVKTLKSYEVISKKTEMPVAMYYRENSVDKPRQKVDAEIETALILIAAIFSGENRELDMSDLKNFINYHKVTTFTPKLNLLDFFSQDIVLRKGESLVSLTTLVDENTSSHVDILTEYQATGFLPDSSKKNISVELPIHACIVSGYFIPVVEQLESKLKSYDEVRKTVVEKTIVSDISDATDEGVIL